jgi:hypothetical protein
MIVDSICIALSLFMSVCFFEFAYEHYRWTLYKRAFYGVLMGVLSGTVAAYILYEILLK